MLQATVAGAVCMLQQWPLEWSLHRNPYAGHDGWSAKAHMLHLQGMGFSKVKAKEALEECHYRLDMAVEWLVSHCV
jgi:hypothetical protein